MKAIQAVDIGLNGALLIARCFEVVRKARTGAKSSALELSAGLVEHMLD